MIFMLAGTSDAKQLAEKLKEDGEEIVVSVVTEEAAKKLRASGIRTRVGRLTDEEMIQVLKEERAVALLDASHPFAEEASRNAIEAAKRAEIPYIRYERQSIHTYDEQVTKVASYEEAAELANKKGGTVFLTTGSKTLATFAKVLLPNKNVRMICRMLPRTENMEKCQQLGIEQKNIVAMQGPFSKELNLALYKQFDTDVVVTKESGKEGSFDEKVTAALELGLDVILIERPRISYGTVFHTEREVRNYVKNLMKEGV